MSSHPEYHMEQQNKESNMDSITQTKSVPFPAILFILNLPKVEKIIQEIESDDVIKQHYGPMTWLANPFLVPKPDGSMRTTVDLRGLNKALNIPHLLLPREEDIMPMFNGNSIISKLDLKTAFHQFELDTASRPLTVFRAGDRLMRYTCLTTYHQSSRKELPLMLRKQSLSLYTTTDAEKNYSQVDLEATAIDFGLQQFRHILVVVPPVTVITDNKYLIVTTDTTTTPSRKKIRGTICTT
eukprot:gene5811-6508_t